MFSYFKSKLKNTIKSLSNIGFGLANKIKSVFSKPIDESVIADLEQVLYESDLGVSTSIEICDLIKNKLKKTGSLSPDEVVEITKDYITNILASSKNKKIEIEKTPHVIMVVGANGSGKTTSIAKLAKFYKDQNKSVVIAAADTFRAAANEQISKWAQKVGVDIVESKHGADPAAVCFDAIEKAKSKNIDIVILDTAGRLHTKTDLMGELEKIKRVCKKQIDLAPHETLLVLDATIGQNAINQAKTFNDFTPITGLLLSKFDGSAKGGIIVAIKKSLDLDVLYVGIGETPQDFLLFNTDDFINALFAKKTT
jgi:fused signal recognition particle receptor